MKTFRRTLALALVLILALSALSFADASTVGNGEARKFVSGQGKMGNGETKKLSGEGLNVASAEMELPLYQKYAPELYEEMLALKEEHIAIHEDIADVREALKGTQATKRENVKAFVKQLRETYGEAVKNKEMTQEEVKAHIQLDVEEQFGPIAMGEYKDALVALKVQLEANKEARLKIREEIRTALANQETDLLNGLLTDLAALRYEHVDLDQQHLDILEDILADQN